MDSIENNGGLKNHIFETLFGPRGAEDNALRLDGALGAICGFFGFGRAVVARLIGRRLDAYHQWNAPELPGLLLTNEALEAIYNRISGDSPLTYLGGGLFPWEITGGYAYSVEHDGKRAGFICFIQQKDSPPLEKDELLALTDVLGVLGAFLVTRRIERRMRETSEAQRLILNTLKDAVYVVDQNTYEVLFANANFIGKDISGPCGVSCFRLLGHDSPCVCCGLDMLKGQPDGFSYTFENPERDAGFWHSVTITSLTWPGERPVFLISDRDITEEKLRQQALIEAATFDLFLNIPTVGRLTSRLDKLLGAGKSKGFLFLIDIDNLRLINNAYGYEYGDALLTEITAFLKSFMPKGEYVYRYTTKIFAVLYEDVGEAQADIFVAALYERFSRPWTIRDKSCYITFSAAMVPYGADGDKTAGVLRGAEIAMDKAIDRNRNSFFKPDVTITDDSAAERISVVNDLYALVEGGCRDLLVNYQPVYNVITDDVVYVEALMRWKHPEKGMIPPLKFIKIAEDTSLIGPLSEKVIDMAVAQCKQWQAVKPGLKLCVNFSAVHSYQPGVVRRISDILKAHDFAPQDLIVEINERDASGDQTRLFEFMHNIRELGCNVALDDFGSGMSSLGKLNSAPVDFIKIDRCFTSNICDREYDQAVVRFLAGLSIGVQMVCEGIETKEQLEAVKSLGISICQGYYLCRPLPPEEIVF